MGSTRIGHAASASPPPARNASSPNAQATGRTSVTTNAPLIVAPQRRRSPASAPPAAPARGARRPARRHGCGLAPVSGAEGGERGLDLVHLRPVRREVAGPERGLRGSKCVFAYSTRPATSVGSPVSGAGVADGPGVEDGPGVGGRPGRRRRRRADPGRPSPCASSSSVRASRQRVAPDDGRRARRPRSSGTRGTPTRWTGGRRAGGTAASRPPARR